MARPPRRGRAFVVLVTTAIVVLSATACAPVRPAIVTSNAPVAHAPDTVTAVRSSITPVLSLDATVTASIGYQATSPVQGVLQVGAGDKLGVEDSEGTVHEVSLVPRSIDVTPILPPGSAVSAGEPVASATFGGVALLAPLKPADILRFLKSPQSARAEINGSGGPFDCSLLDSRPSIAGDGTSFVACAIPPDVVAIAGLSGVVAIRFPTSENVVVLPIAAVSGSLGSGEILKLVGTRFRVTKVQLGASDGEKIAITSGLAAGDVVEVPGPSLLDG
jgi:hypothetical protein